MAAAHRPRIGVLATGDGEEVWNYIGVLADTLSRCGLRLGENYDDDDLVHDLHSCHEAMMMASGMIYTSGELPSSQAAFHRLLFASAVCSVDEYRSNCPVNQMLWTSWLYLLRIMCAHEVSLSGGIYAEYLHSHMRFVSCLVSAVRRVASRERRYHYRDRVILHVCSFFSPDIGAIYNISFAPHWPLLDVPISDPHPSDPAVLVEVAGLPDEVIDGPSTRAHVVRSHLLHIARHVVGTDLDYVVMPHSRVCVGPGMAMNGSCCCC